ncbi:hypothetical protein OPT61_g9000 [Boeremia exigua]|uniref:Uncharacterized protein n=1 Tax=Boeremia exigua TaxID=749465 RepID=A0ACC2HWD2_9PLEO|nr:hypothetical protein OPT61_g9000 [Boeremia exigua]
MPQQQHNINASQEAQVQLALQALKQDANLSQRRAAAIYRVPQSTLSYRHTGRPSRADTMPNSRGSDNNEEQLADVAAIANSLHAERNLGPVSTNWPSTFVKRQLELKVKFNWKYNYKRALCEDPEVIQGWFSLLGNREWTTVIQGINAKGWAIPPFIIFKARYYLTGWYKEEDLSQDWVIGVSSNSWTTNELGFKWLKHFDRHTKERTVGTY